MIESVYKTTVHFPQINELDELKGDKETKEEHLLSIIKNKKSNLQFNLLQCTTKTKPKTWRTEVFLSCFPLQFPFGTGAKPNGLSTVEYY